VGGQYVNVILCCAYTFDVKVLSNVIIEDSCPLVGARGGVVVKELRYKPQVAGSIPDGVIGIFQ